MKTLDEIEGAILNEAKVKKPNLDQKQNEKEKKSLKKMLTKVVIRRLPPLMTEEEFLKQTEPLPDHDYLYFVPADWSLGQHASSRAYINFVRHEDIFLFKDKFDGYVFVDNKGVEHPAVVEFAPFQGLPKNKSRKKDKKCNTIDKDQHFVNFLASLANDENETNKPEMKMEYSFQLKDDKKITSTPLLEFLANRKQESRDERRRKNGDRKKQQEEKNQKKDQQSRSDDNNSSRGGGRDKKKRDALKQKNKQSYPPPIPEEDNNDGIIVRTVKSRLGNNNNNDRKRGDRVFESKQKQQNQSSNKNTTTVADTQQKSIAKDDHNDRDKDRDRDRKPSMDNNNEQRRAANAQRESNRRKERKLRKMERENNRKDGGDESTSMAAGASGEGNVSGGNNKNQTNKETDEKTNESNKQDSTTPKTTSKSLESNQSQSQREEKVKKYSESRRDRRSSRNENKSKDNLIKTTTKPQMSQQSNNQTVDEIKTLKSTEPLDDADADVKPQRRQSIDSKNDSGSGGDNSRDNSKAKQEEREHLGRIRNKDRPSLQIYQPGKRRPTGSSKDDKTNPNSPTERMAKTPEFETNIEIIENSLSKIEGKLLPKEEKTEKLQVAKVEKQSQPVVPVASTPIAVEEVLPSPTMPPPPPPPATEKRVSRYSERRNRNKERLSKRDDIQKLEQTCSAVPADGDDDKIENITKEIKDCSMQIDNNDE